MTASRYGRTVGAVFACVVAITPTSARAQNGPDPEKLFNDAMALMEAQRYAEACPKFEESQRLDPGLGTQFNLAVCYEKVGRIGTAWRQFREVATLARATGKKQREEASRQKMEELKPKLAYLVLRSKETADVTVTVDGASAPKSDWEYFVVDAGAHEIRASAPAKQPWATKTNVALAQHVEIEIPALAAFTNETRVVTVTKETTDTRRTLGFALGGLGVAGLAAAGVTGVLLLQDKSTADDKCQPHCVDQEGRDAVSRGKTLLMVNAVAWGVGIVGVGVGAFFLLTSGNKSEPEKTAIVPYIGPAGGGLGMRGSF